MANRYRKGDWNVICDRTGFKKKASDCRMEWTGLFVHKSEWESRHPQDKIRGIADFQAVSIPRPEPTEDTFVGTNEVQY